MWHTKAAMAVLLLAGILIASVPGITVTHLFSHLWDVEINNNVTYDVDVVGKKASGEGDMLRGGTCNYYCLACICLRNGFKPIYNKDYWVLGCNADRYYCGFDVGII
ncbi:MAG: hypothetical protein ACLVLP_00900 [Phascolarctobacterium faecium]|uniref:hypothetical protein n=1 Tax=Phascolarctobacterium faecium TaxID=33025 RepID=UPI003999BF3D